MYRILDSSKNRRAAGSCKSVLLNGGFLPPNGANDMQIILHSSIWA